MAGSQEIPVTALASDADPLIRSSAQILGTIEARDEQAAKQNGRRPLRPPNSSSHAWPQLRKMRPTGVINQSWPSAAQGRRAGKFRPNGRGCNPAPALTIDPAIVNAFGQCPTEFTSRGFDRRQSRQNQLGGTDRASPRSRR